METNHTKPTGHTPGPWKTGQSIGLVFNEKGLEVCEVSFGEDSVVEANARLIAAAPELLTHLIEVTRRLEYVLEQEASFKSVNINGNAVRRECVTKARAAIDKATMPVS